MSFEESVKKFENSDAQENKAEKKPSLSEIDELIKEKASIFDNLDKFSKDEIFKKENFSDLRVAVDRPDDKFDEGKNEVVKKILTEKEITEIALKELKTLGVSVLGGSDEDKRIRTEAMKNLPILMKSVFANLAKFKDKFEEKDIKKEVQEWYKKFTKKSK